MYDKKPKYDITNYLNTNKSAPPAKASYGMSGAPITGSATQNVASRKEESKPSPVKAPVTTPQKPSSFKSNTAPTFSATAKKESVNIGGKPIVVPKKRVLTDAQKLASQKLKAMGAKIIANNKAYNAKKPK